MKNFAKFDTKTNVFEAIVQAQVLGTRTNYFVMCFRTCKMVHEILQSIIE